MKSGATSPTLSSTRSPALRDVTMRVNPRAMAAADAPSRRMVRDYERAQAAVSAASRGFIAQKEALAGIKSEIESVIGPMRSVASAEDLSNVPLDRFQGTNCLIRPLAKSLARN